jgi:hypothetical protein
VHSGHCPALALNGSVAIDPKRTCDAAYAGGSLVKLRGGKCRVDQYGNDRQARRYSAAGL